MACNDNPVAKLNEFCQKNKLTYSFEKTGESGMSHNKLFRMCLTIARMGCKEYIQFSGEGNSLKTAKNDAAQNAFKAGIIIELKKVAISMDAVPTSNVQAIDGKSNVAQASQLNDLVMQAGRFTINDGPDPIYEVYCLSRTYHLPFNFEYVNIRKGFTHSKLSVKLVLGKRHFSGKGTNDLEAIYDAASQVKSQEYANHPREDGELSSDDDSSHKVQKLHELHQHLDKKLEFTCLTQLGPPQDPLFIFKCAFGDLVSYGLGKNKKASKNRSACMMLRKLNEHVEIENVKTNLCNLDRWVDDKAAEKVKDVVYSRENAISVLEALDRIRFERTLKFTESAKEIGVQIYFTTECKLLYGADLKIHDKKIDDQNMVTKNEMVYLKTSAKSSKKKTSKMEAAEKMLNLIRGDGAFTNEEVKLNQELSEYRETAFSLKEDQIDKNVISREYQDYLAQMIAIVDKFLEDKPNYDPDFDFLAELQDLEFAYRGHLKLDVKSSNEVYKVFSNPNYEPFVNCIINFTCGISLSAHAKAENEIEAKNLAAYELLKKLTKTKTVFF